MPNWVANKVVMTGDKHTISAVKNQLSQPYDSHHWDFATNSIGHRRVEGDFLLWNIIRPTNLAVYYEYDKRMAEAKQEDPEPTRQVSADDVVGMLKARLAEITPESFAEAAHEFHEELRVGQDWYHWNIRNWGTKWEIGDASLVREEDERLEFVFDTAWSPPVPALDELSAQYENLVITLVCIDEGDMFASEIHWRHRERAHEHELDITHGLKEEMYGECWVCASDHADDPEMAEYRKNLRCDEFNTKIEIEGVI